MGKIALFVKSILLLGVTAYVGCFELTKDDLDPAKLSAIPTDYEDESENESDDGCLLFSDSTVQNAPGDDYDDTLEIIVKGDRLFVLTESELGIYEVDPPYKPVLMHGIRDAFDDALTFDVSDDYIFILETQLIFEPYLFIYSYKERNKDPEKVATFRLDNASNIKVTEDHVLISSYIDEATVAQPVTICPLDVFEQTEPRSDDCAEIFIEEGQVEKILIAGTKMFAEVISSNYKQDRSIVILDISKMPDISQVSSKSIDSPISNMFVDGNILYLSMSGEDEQEEVAFYRFDSNGKFDFEGSIKVTDYRVYSIAVRQDLLYIAEGSGGRTLAIWDISSLNTPTQIETYSEFDDEYISCQHLAFNREFDDNTLYLAGNTRLTTLTLCDE